MTDEAFRALGLSINHCDLVLLITKDGLPEEDLDALDPLVQELSDTLQCSIVTLPDAVFSDMKVLNLSQLLALREDIDEAIASKLTNSNIPTA